MTKDRKFTRFIWSLLALSILFTIAGLVFEITRPGAAFDLGGLLNTVTLYVFVLVSACVGALIVSRQPRNTVGWLLMFFPVVGPVLDLIDRFARTLIPASSQSAQFVLLSTWFNSWSWWLLMGPILLIPLYFPTGKLPSPRWRVVVAGIVLCFASFVLVTTFSLKVTNPDTGISFPNPLGLLSEAAANQLIVIIQILLLTVALASVASIFVRFRRTSGIEREQIKWFLYACTIFIALYASFMFSELTESDWAGVLFNLTLCGLPLAIGAAILRYHLWDIDLLIRRTLAYTLLTASMAIVFFGGVTLLQRLFTIISGQQSVLATLISTLLIAALFNPLRHRFQRAIDRRYNRKKYVAQRVLDAFVGSARSQTDPGALSAELIQVAQQALEPETINLWIRDRR